MEKRKNVLSILFINLALLFAVSCSYMKTDLGNETIDVSITQIKTSSGDTGVILSFNTVSSDLEIPDIVQGLPVLKLSFAKTSNISSLYSITIPSSVIEIDTFKGATSLSTVTLPEKLTSLPIFTGCTKLKNIIIPGNITQIPESCFEGCKALTVITLPDTIQLVGSEAFSGCTALDSFIIPKNVTKIDDSAFAGTALKELYCYPTEPPVILKTSFPKMELEEKTSGSNTESQTEETETEEDTESEKEKVYKKVFTLYIPAGSETLYKEKWNDFVDWRVIDIQTL